MASHDSIKIAYKEIDLVRYRSECARAVTAHAMIGARRALEHAREALAESRLRMLRLARTFGRISRST